MWLLDTNAWIAYLEREPNPVKTHIAERPEAQIPYCDFSMPIFSYNLFYLFLFIIFLKFIKLVSLKS